MNKDIKDSIDSIQVPIDKLDKAIERGLLAGKKQTSPKRKKMFTLLLSGAATIGLIIGSGFVSPTMAEVLAKVPLLDSIFKTVGDKGLQAAIEDQNVASLNKTITSNGVSITIQEVLYDGNRLAFSFVQSNHDEIYPLNIEVNGEAINFSENLRSSYIENGQYVGLIQIYPTEPLPDEFDLYVEIPQIGEKKGNWHFETHVVKTNNDTLSLAVGQQAEVDGISYEVKKFESTNSGLSLQILYDTTPDVIMNKNHVLQLHLLDQEGVPIPIINQHSSSDGEGILFEYLFEPISEEVSTLTISPFFMPNSIEIKEITTKLDESKLPLTLSQGEMGDIVVTQVKEDGNRYALFFESTSTFPFGLNFEMNHLSLEDSIGNDLIVEGGYPKAIGKNKYKLFFTKPANGDNIILKTIELPIMKLNKESQITVFVPQ